MFGLTKRSKNLKIWVQEWEKPGGPIATSWDYIQRKFECCGVTEYQDWQNAPLFINYAQNRSSVENPVPDSCCQGCSQFDLLLINIA